MSKLFCGAVVGLALLPAALTAQKVAPGSDGRGEVTVTVTGDVLKPGTYRLTAGMTALDALKVAEGSLNDIERSVVLRHDRAGNPQEFSFGNAGPLRPGDVVLVQGVYVLRRDQILLIDVENHPELTGRHLVQDDGTIIMPGAGRISVGQEPNFKGVIATAVHRATGRTPRVTVTEVQNRW
jgi:protein involved in polysaccharide export with SLBB domain